MMIQLKPVQLKPFQSTLGHRYYRDVIVDGSQVEASRHESFRHWVNVAVHTRMAPGGTATATIIYPPDPG